MSHSLEEVKAILKLFTEEYMQPPIISCGKGTVKQFQPLAEDKNDHCIVVLFTREPKEGEVSVPETYQGVKVFSEVVGTGEPIRD